MYIYIIERNPLLEPRFEYFDFFIKFFIMLFISIYLGCLKSCVIESNNN